MSSTTARRPMSAALKTVELSGEALAFVRQGTPQPQVATPRAAATEVATPAEATAPLSVSIEPSVVDQPISKPKAPRAATQPEALVNLSFRVPTTLHAALKRASFEREMAREEPYTQQDIVAEALNAWLKKHAS